MITVQEALNHVYAQAKPLAVEEVNLLQARGRVLAKLIIADRDFPPFHRATMDGVAINTAVFEQGQRQFPVEAIQPAGRPQLELQSTHHCIEIMTGAMLPVGCNAVIRYEDVELKNQVAHVQLDTVTAYQNIHLQGADEKEGQTLITAGTKITPAIIAIAASVGLTQLSVYQLPRVAVCSTGDELVAITEKPEPHQIRQSNSYMLIAGLAQEGIIADRYHLPDKPTLMAEQMAGLVKSYDVLLFSGAVSKGKFDFLPQVLQQLNMQTLFHSIAQKPGKPLLFGKFDSGVLVFGFPGNPVSTWICYQIYFRAWLYQSLNIKLPTVQAAASKPLTFKPALVHHVLVKLANDDGRLIATPVNTSTSGDMVNLMQAEGYLSLPAEQDTFEAGTLFDVQLF
jgi:molybdopterin molybdotransferase